MGTLNKRGGIYYGNYLDLRTGRRCQKSLRTGDLKLARLRLRDLELATTDSGPHASETLDAALSYFVDVVHATSPEATVTCYRQKARHLSDELGSMTVDQLKAEHVERYIARRCGNGPESDGAHRHSVHKEPIVLRGTLKSARSRGTFRGVVADVVPPFKSGYTPRETYLTPDRFMARSRNLIVPRTNPRPATVAREHDRRIKRTRYLLLGGLAACRKGELSRLQWELVDLARNVITVPKSKVRAAAPDRGPSRSTRCCGRGSRGCTRAPAPWSSPGPRSGATCPPRVPALVCHA